MDAIVAGLPYFVLLMLVAPRLVADWAEAADFHRSVALSRAGAAARGGGRLGHWRWRGVLTEYVVVGPGDVGGGERESRGNVLLVHGFGAFGEHYRDAASSLARRGFTVYAPTLPGYGRSEKPPARKPTSTPPCPNRVRIAKNGART